MTLAQFFTGKKVILMAGFPGSGKSTLAKKIAGELQGYHLSSDKLREELFHSDRYDSRGDEHVSTLRSQIYTIAAEKIRSLLKESAVVVFDATNLEGEKRKQIIDHLTPLISKHEICFVSVQTPQSVIDTRMKKLDSKTNQNNESLYDGWKRVYKIFTQKQKKGRISWPEYDDINCYTSDQLPKFEHEQTTMNINFPFTWFADSIKTNFDQKFDSNAASTWITNHHTQIAQYAADLESAVALFNSIYITKTKNHPAAAYCANAVHTARVLGASLPSYYDQMQVIKNDRTLHEKTIQTLTTSAYFKMVYQLSPISHIVANLMILFYRTSLLEQNPSYMENEVQFSSTLEEMTMLREIDGVKTSLIDPILVWIDDWQDEGFDKNLIDIFSKKN